MMNQLPQLLDVNIDLTCKPNETFSLRNDIKMSCFHDKDSEIIRLEFMFMNAGSVNQNRFFASASASNLITEGCGNMSAIEVADKLDYYAAYVEKVTERDATSLVFYFLKKYQEHLLPLIEQIIKQANYTDREFELYIAKQKQNFEINAQKTAMMAYKEFYRTIFPEQHSLSLFGEKDDFDTLTAEDVREFYRSFYTSSQSEIVLSGNYSDDFLKQIEKYFGEEKWGRNEGLDLKDYTISTKESGNGVFKLVNKTGAAQASVRMGSVSLNHRDKDFLPFSVVVCLLGGYFGSRLMMNIREDKGYTYGISANLSAYRYASVLSISSDVKADKAKETLNEVEKEIIRLQNDLVSEAELSQVKNYLIGDCIRNLDGAFDKADKYSFLKKMNYEYDYYKDFIQTIKTITIEDVRDLSQRYLDLRYMSKIIVGDNKIIA